MLKIVFFLPGNSEDKSLPYSNFNEWFAEYMPFSNMGEMVELVDFLNYHKIRATIILEKILETKLTTLINNFGCDLDYFFIDGVKEVTSQAHFDIIDTISNHYMVNKNEILVVTKRQFTLHKVPKMEKVCFLANFEFYFDGISELKDIIANHILYED